MMEQGAASIDTPKARMSRTALGLLLYLLLINCLPALPFVYYWEGGIRERLAILLFPIGLFTVLLCCFKNLGKGQFFYLPILIIHAFQVVIFFLFGSGPIDSDMFLNVVTTSNSEIGELFASLRSGFITIALVYLPALGVAAYHWRRATALPQLWRIRIAMGGLAILCGALMLGTWGKTKEQTSPFKAIQAFYPLNDWYNLGFSIYKSIKIKRLPQSTAQFSYQANCQNGDTGRKVLLLIIGETARPMNWALYGYERPTNPLLSQVPGLTVFKDAISQSNYTHKSVSTILSGTGAEDYHQIYQRKGVFQAFKELGYRTAYLTNQKESSFISFFAREADSYHDLTAQHKKGASVYDEQLLPFWEALLDADSQNLFVIMHLYGSHFNYSDRYPSHFKRLMPDEVTALTPSQKEQMVNAYDNSILYTDFVLYKIMESMSQREIKGALLYASDHGEDLYDDFRKRALHASPTITYYQLRIPFLIWFSEAYTAKYPSDVDGVEANKNKAVSTNTLVPTLMALARIQSPYFKSDLSLINPNYQEKERLYLNDHDKPIPYRQMGLTEIDKKMLQLNNIKY